LFHLGIQPIARWLPTLRLGLSYPVHPSSDKLLWKCTIILNICQTTWISLSAEVGCAQCCWSTENK
jgi:hypothetical protein